MGIFCGYRDIFLWYDAGIISPSLILTPLPHRHPSHPLIFTPLTPTLLTSLSSHRLTSLPAHPFPSPLILTLYSLTPHPHPSTLSPLIFTSLIFITKTQHISVLNDREKAMVRRLILLKVLHGWNKGVRLQRVRYHNAHVVISRYVRIRTTYSCVRFRFLHLYFQQ